MSNDKRKLSVAIVIPCFNEAESLPQLAANLKTLSETMGARCELEYLLVDDGSTDSTLNDLKALRDPLAKIQVLEHSENRGLGAALKTAFAVCKSDIIVTTDSDGTYGFDQIPMIVDLLVKSGADIVTASPYHPNGGVENVPSHRLVLSKGASFLYRALISREIHTYTALFRAFRGDVLTKTKITSDGFLGVTEFLVNAVLAGCKVVEFPTLLRVRRYGSSKARLVKIILSHLKFQTKLIFKMG